MNKEITFSKTAIIFSARESIWKVLQSEQLYQTAWAAKLNTTWEPGAKIRFSGIWENVEYSDKGEVLINQPYSFLKYSYWSSFWEVADTPEEYCFISYKINPLNDGSCEFTIAQDGFRDEKHYSDTVELLVKTMDMIKYESEKLDLTSRCENAFSKLISFVDSAQQDLYNKPVANGWSVGQVVEHVIMSSSGLKQFLSEATSSSDPYDSKVPEIRAMILNTTQNLKTPDTLIPPFNIYNSQQHTQQLTAISREINDCIRTLDFRNKIETFPMPPFGYMSIFEWLTFTVFHISRHTLQLERLL